MASVSGHIEWHSNHSARLLQIGPVRLNDFTSSTIRDNGREVTFIGVKSFSQVTQVVGMKPLSACLSDTSKEWHNSILFCIAWDNRFFFVMNKIENDFYFFRLRDLCCNYTTLCSVKGTYKLC